MKPLPRARLPDLLHITVKSRLCRAFLAQRRGDVRPCSSSMPNAAGGELKTDWTKPDHEVASYGFFMLRFFLT